MDCAQWDAWYDKMPGGDPYKLHVAGRCTCESSSIELSLEPGNEGIIDEPDLYVLELKADVPPVGDTQVVEKDVSWTGPAKGIKRVRIQGATTAHITVRDVS